mmetsp:Transcript_14169/g.27542  ORF Transcript_14169/g.27542 Transcript_14169/m.27542 type:complete len:660 (-) Transcript_14169:121-2100(-)
MQVGCNFNFGRLPIAIRFVICMLLGFAVAGLECFEDIKGVGDTAASAAKLGSSDENFKRSFEASRNWQVVEPFHELPLGLDIKLDFEAGTRHARIPDPWKLRIIITVDDLIQSSFNTDVWIPTSTSTPWKYAEKAIVENLRIHVSCLVAGQTLTDLASAHSVEELFYSTRGRANLKAVVSGSYSCVCGTSHPCRLSLGHLQSCYAQEVDWSNATLHKSALKDICKDAKEEYAACTLACSAYQDTILLDKGLFTRSPIVVDKSEIVDSEFSRAIPGDSLDSWCRSCGFAQGRVLFALGAERYARAQAADATEWLMARAHFQPYLKDLGLGETRATGIQQLNCDAMSKDPVVFVSVWSLVNIYHLLADLIIPLYDRLSRAGFETSRTTIFIDVGHDEQRAKLQNILKAANSLDSPLGLLKLFFREVHAMQALRIASRQSTYCFENLFLEAPKLPFVKPFDVEVNDAAMKARGIAFRRAVQARVSRHFPVLQESSRGLGGLFTFIKRKGHRKFLNLREAKLQASEIFEPIGLSIRDVVVERLDFAKQWSLFQRTRILCCVHGQGCSNVAFLPERAVLILVMPPEYFGYRWVYARLARWLGVRVVVHEPSVLPDPNAGWHGIDSDYLHSDINGVHPLRDQDVTLEVDAWRNTLRKALIALVDD